MKLYVHVIEARNLLAMDPNGSSDPYVRLQLGKQRFKTKVVKKSLNPSWNEEFSLRVEDLNEELAISVLDEDKYFNDDFIGLLKVPVLDVFDADNQTFGPAWFTLQPRNKKSKSKDRDCGDVFLYLSFSGNNSGLDQIPPRSLSANGNHIRDLHSSSLSGSSEDDMLMKEEKLSAQAIANRLVLFFRGKTAETVADGDLVSPEFEETTSEIEVQKDDADGTSEPTFDVSMKTLESRDQSGEMPNNLPGGVLVDQHYLITPSELNSLLFAPGSSFKKALAELQSTTDMVEGPWTYKNGGDRLARVVTSTKAATRLVKAVKATEEQTYLKADGRNYAVLVSVSTPDVPYGNHFRCELLFCILPGSELPSGDQSTRLMVSWRMNFLQSTMMKGMIESGARQGLKESYDQFAELLSRHAKVIDLKEVVSAKDNILAPLQMEQQSDWKLAVHYFGNFTVISAFFIGIYVLAHIMLAMPSTVQGLEFTGLDLPDSVGEVIVCGILVLQAKRVLDMIARFMLARLQRGSDHGIKAQGNGWLLTVALVEGISLAAVDSTGFSDPYVVFTCNGKTRTSSIKFQILDPQWNEIFEFDAMDEPPSTMDVEVFDFDGPFDEAISLGYTEINFLKTNLSELADIWVPLQGKLAQACQSKLHLRIFLNNTKGTDIIKEYLTKMEKEVGKKINLRSPQTNSSFQKLFGLPPEEFLINDFTCYLKRKMPVQGRIFLSARIIGFYTNLFGHKTKFFFLWEDIEDIQVIPPSLASVGSPSLVITLRRGRGIDAKHGAKTRDEEGRLKFHFQSFVSFQKANKTIMALWKARSLSPEQKVQMVEEESETKLQTEESTSFLGNEDTSLSEVYSALIPVPIHLLLELFNGGDLERRVMDQVGCLNYSCAPWELVRSDVYQREIYYKFRVHVSRYGGEVTSIQQKSPLSDRNGWTVEEVMTLQGVPLGDYFNLHLRYHFEVLPNRSNASNVQVFMGIQWLKGTRNQKRITKNVISKLAERLREMFSIAEKEFMSDT